MDWRAKVELFEEIRREYEFGVGTIAGTAKKLGVRSRTLLLKSKCRRRYGEVRHVPFNADNDLAFHMQLVVLGHNGDRSAVALQGADVDGLTWRVA